MDTTIVVWTILEKSGTNVVTWSQFDIVSLLQAKNKDLDYFVLQFYSLVLV